MYRNCLELDTEAGLLRVKDEKGDWHGYKKRGICADPSPGGVLLPAVHLLPDDSVVLWSENNVRSAPEVVVVSILADHTNWEYVQEA